MKSPPNIPESHRDQGESPVYCWQRRTLVLLAINIEPISDCETSKWIYLSVSRNLARLDFQVADFLCLPRRNPGKPTKRNVLAFVFVKLDIRVVPWFQAAGSAIDSAVVLDIKEISLLHELQVGLRLSGVMKFGSIVMEEFRHDREAANDDTGRYLCNCPVTHDNDVVADIRRIEDLPCIVCTQDGRYTSPGQMCVSKTLFLEKIPMTSGISFALKD